MKGRDTFTKFAKKPQAGCGKHPICLRKKQWASFPPDVQQRITQFTQSLIAFSNLCESKRRAGQNTVDKEIAGSFEAIKKELLQLHSEAHLYPELPNELVHRIENHGNALIKRQFLN